MSDKSSEYLKRTCLICGCHTNQTINIYEPRSGPNIVQLIQAKFKFQPLNEDKYLCFSCNNWLINWHSLQALNSNDADSPSGTFRPHMNSMLNEKGGDSEEQARQQSQEQKSVTRCRPVAQVRPWHLTPEPTTDEKLEPRLSKAISPTSLNTSITISKQTLNSKATHHTSTKAVMDARMGQSRGRSQQSCNSKLNPPKNSRFCCMCGKRLAPQRYLRSGAVKRKNLTPKCRKCYIICIHLRAVEQWKQSKTHKMQPKSYFKRFGLVANRYTSNGNHNATADNTNADTTSEQTEPSRHCFKQPLVDGKVVAMLRRLGTTLSREDTCENGSSAAITTATASQKPLPLIMSPAKPKPRWTRPLDKDEILLDFDAAISEVLPQLASQNMLNQREEQQQPANQISELKQVKRKLTYQMTNGKENRQSAAYTAVLPKGLSISLV